MNPIREERLVKPRATTAVAVLRASLRLGLTSFGGPIAHLGYFERAYVRRLGWLTREQYTNLVALCQILPGPTSSQVGFLIGLQRAGWLGAVAAWVGFTLPSALLLYAGALFSAHAHTAMAQAALHGIRLMAVAVVAQAVWSMGRQLCPDLRTALIAVIATAALVMAGGTLPQLAALAVGAAVGGLVCRPRETPYAPPPIGVSRNLAWGMLLLFALLFFGLAVFAARHPRSGIALASIFYRAGALVFGGGHVVLPLLRAALVPAGWISDDQFLTGYGLAQAVPGPLFTVAAYLGAATRAIGSSPAYGAVVATVFIFLPGLLIAPAGMSLWAQLQRSSRLSAAFAGVNAMVVGMLAAALCDLVRATLIQDPLDALTVLVALILLARFQISPIIVLALCIAQSSARLVV